MNTSPPSLGSEEVTRLSPGKPENKSVSKFYAGVTARAPNEPDNLRRVKLRRYQNHLSRLLRPHLVHTPLGSESRGVHPASLRLRIAEVCKIPSEDIESARRIPTGFALSDKSEKTRQTLLAGSATLYIIDTINPVPTNTLFAGDFNAHHDSWESGIEQQNTSGSRLAKWAEISMQYHSGSDHFPLSIHIPLTVPRAPLATRYYLSDDYKDAFVDAVGTALQNYPRAYISSQADLLANFITSTSMDALSFMSERKVQIMMESDLGDITDQLCGLPQDRLIAWGRLNGMFFSPSKTEVINFSRRLSNPAPTIAHDDIEIVTAPTLKWLVAHLDSALSFRTHIEQRTALTRSVAHYIRGLCKTTRGIPPTAVQKAIQTIVIPKMMYASEIWWPGRTRPAAKRENGNRPRVANGLKELLKKL
ncbi:unnamed protein product [Fusarium graminearum]|nr:unnamed protein product [Fusarium graminearum]